MQSGEGLTVALLLLGNLLGGLLLLLCHRYGSLPRMPGHATHDQSLGHSIVGIDRRFKLVFLLARSFVRGTQAALNRHKEELWMMRRKTVKRSFKIFSGFFRSRWITLRRSDQPRVVHRHVLLEPVGPPTSPKAQIALRNLVLQPPAGS